MAKSGDALAGAAQLPLFTLRAVSGHNDEVCFHHFRGSNDLHIRLACADQVLAADGGGDLGFSNAGQLLAPHIAQVALQVRKVGQAEFRSGGFGFGHIEQKGGCLVLLS